MRLWVRPGTRGNPSPGFSRAVASAPDPAHLQGSACQSALSPGQLLPGRQAVNKHRQRSPGLAPASPGSWASPRTSVARFGNVNPIPFRVRRSRATRIGVGLPLRTDSPMSHRGSHGTLLPFGLQGSHLNICYSHQDPHWGPFHAGSRPALRHGPHALLHTGATARAGGGVSVARWSAIHFQG
jgi:hypothetical protein